MTGKDAADQLTTSPRLIKTHFPVQFVPRSFWEQNCRVTVTSTNSNHFTTSICNTWIRNASHPGFSLRRSSMWLVMQRTTWCPISTLTAWTTSSQNQGTGTPFCTVSWQEKVSSNWFYWGQKKGLLLIISSILCVFYLFNPNSVTFGSWYDHVKGWWEKKQEYSNIHYMFYEDLIEVRASGTGLWIDFTGCSKPVFFNVL